MRYSKRDREMAAVISSAIADSFTNPSALAQPLSVGDAAASIGASLAAEELAEAAFLAANGPPLDWKGWSSVWWRCEAEALIRCGWEPGE